MTHTQLDSDFLVKKHFVVNQITKELLDALEANALSREAGRELATEVLEEKDTWQTTDDLLNYLKKSSGEYPFLLKLYESFQRSIKEEVDEKSLSAKDNQKLEQIQDQLSKLSQAS